MVAKKRRTSLQVEKERLYNETVARIAAGNRGTNNPHQFIPRIVKTGPGIAAVCVPSITGANTEPVTDDDIKVLYRVCKFRSLMVALLKDKAGDNGDAELYDRVMGKLQHTMDLMGLTVL